VNRPRLLIEFADAPVLATATPEDVSGKDVAPSLPTAYEHCAVCSDYSTPPAPAHHRGFLLSTNP
jgi:hypothetical protein